ncbi:MAG TPA: protein kinase [Thermoanaerobaculia bacterium]|jgi:serine/threonine-protein kinase
MKSQRVGPYRLERKLGAGGMGSVYAAWDERLERLVALKQIRPEGADDPHRWQRFRREARALAKLDHPSIVRIHDLLETRAGDWLVLQYVAGVPLAERLRQGPLPPGQVVSLARDVLSALEAAHTQGVLHRDLKAENVILTRSGRAMVLDFGLAKLFALDSPASGTPPAALSVTPGGLVGTYRSMSPEQANGLPLDTRSDLFSAGVLLYEAATGVSPFRGETTVETLTRVCTHLQPPVHELAATVPELLSAWIDALLEKDLARRPPSAGEALARLEAVDGPAFAVQAGASPPSPGTAATAGIEDETTVSAAPYRGPRHPRHLPLVLALVAVMGAFLIWRLRSPPEPLYVAVARPEVGLGAGREEVALAASALQAASLRALSSLEGIAALSPGAPQAGGPAPSPRQLARLLAADEVLASSLDCQARQCLAVLRRVRGSDGRILDVQTFEVPLDDLPLLDTAAASYLKRGYGGFQSRPDASRLQVRGEDYERFLRVQRIWEEERPSHLEPLFAELGRIRAGSPLFLDAYLLEARLAGRRFFDTRDARDLDRSLALISQARTLAPGDPLPLVTLFGVALPAGRLTEAEAALRELEQRQPGDVWTLHRRALLSEQRGDRRQALRLLRAAVERHPSVQFSLDLANLEMRLGDVPAARRSLEDLLRRFPGHPGGETLLAQLELEFGSPARAAELYSRLVRRNPGFAELSNLGLAQLLLGRYSEAAASFRQASDLSPNSAAATLNRADAEMLLGRRIEAMELYRRVLARVEQDPVPDFWQTLSIKAQAQAHLGRAPEAATSIQRAVVAAPDNPQVAFEAALVYAVIGDTASALASAERALDSGYDRRWFALPWFDRLRQEPAFRKRIAAPGAKSSAAD